MKTLSYLALAAVLLAHPGTGAAQEEGEQSAESRTARQAIAQYPADIREAVCVVAGHPELLVKLARIQHQSSADFAALLDPYGRRDQEALWDLARFPGLIDKLADCDLQDEAEMDEVLTEYPAEIGVTARRYARREPEVLVEIAGLHRRTEARFNALLSAYPPQTQDQARLLLQYPELLSRLDTDLDQIILLGDAYRQDPDQVRQQLAQLHLERAGSTRPDRPASRREEAPPASRSRAGRYDYDLNGLDEPEEDTRVEVVYHHSYYDYPYPYWFGYPRWYGPAGWYAGFNWRLNRHVSASIGIEMPVVRRPVPVYGGPVVRKVVKVVPARPRRSKGGWDADHGRGHWNHRSRRH